MWWGADGGQSAELARPGTSHLWRPSVLTAASPRQPKEVKKGAERLASRPTMAGDESAAGGDRKE
jgi:hypothetical protein